MHKIIINFCPNGMVPTKDITKHVPVSTDEIIEQTHEAYELGITIVHIHARDEQGFPTYQPDIYQLIFEGVRRFCPGLIICASTSGRNWSEFEKRSRVIDLKPDMCSLTLSSMNFIKQATVNAPDMIIRLAEKMNEFGVVPELECFDMGMINFGNYLIHKGIIKGPYYWNLLFGNIAGLQATLGQIGLAIGEIPDDHYIGLAGIGANQLPVNAIAIAKGYGVRVGIEDNIWWDKAKTRTSSNIDLIKRVHQLIDIHGSVVMTASELGRKGFYNRKVTSKEQ